MTIFISGAISDNPNYVEQFATAQDKLEREGYVVLNPTCLNPKLSYTQLMILCREMISIADAVYMLDGWEQSKGANFEHTWAKMWGKEIIYEKKTY